MNIRPVVYCTAVRESTDSKEWDHLWNAFKATNVAAEQRVIMEALGCTRNADVLKVIVYSIPVDKIRMKIELYPFQKYLNLILTDDIRIQDKQFAFTTTFHDVDNIDIVLDFFIETHSDIAES